MLLPQDRSWSDSVLISETCASACGYCLQEKNNPAGSREGMRPVELPQANSLHQDFAVMRNGALLLLYIAELWVFCYEAIADW